MIIHGDCIEKMKKMPDNSVDAIVTDPPYGLGFMGKEWDTMDSSQFGIAGNEGENDLKVKKNFKILPRIAEGGALQNFTYEWAKECLRILKSGGHLVSFGGTRTYHRMACGIEDAGFEVRDMIDWIYFSGFPKSLNIGITIGTSQFEGLGTALKPAHEPIILARKPLGEKTIAENVIKYGTGGLGIDSARIPILPDDDVIAKNPHTSSKGTDAYDVNCYGKYNPTTDNPKNYKEIAENSGRFPANVIVQDNVLGSNSRFFDLDLWTKKNGILIFPKASKNEKNKGCKELEEKQMYKCDGSGNSLEIFGTTLGKPRKNFHPTVKPVKLIAWLIKLVAPNEEMTVLDPFMGSGTTGVACKTLNRKFIGIEKESEYVEIAQKRINAYETQKTLRSSYEI